MPIEPSDAVPTVEGYTVLDLVGSSSAAQVWRVRGSDGQLRAAKVLEEPPEACEQQEFGVLQAVQAEHLVTAHDLVRAELNGRPTQAIVMDLCPGGNLATVVGARGHLSPGECVTVLTPVAQALAALHAQGVVHGDLSATNVLFDETGRPAVADLGACLLASQPGRQVWGTAGCVAPEVWAGERPSAASDLYSLGHWGGTA